MKNNGMKKIIFLFTHGKNSAYQLQTWTIIYSAAVMKNKLGDKNIWTVVANLIFTHNHPKGKPVSVSRTYLQ